MISVVLIFENVFIYLIAEQRRLAKYRLYLAVWTLQLIVFLWNIQV